MNRMELLKRLRELNFPPEECWLVTGGAMVLYGLRDETGDIDFGCTHAFFQQLREQGYPVSTMLDGTRRIKYAADVELFEEWLYDRVELLDGVPVLSLTGLIEMKRQIGREKDLRDVERIEAYLAERKADDGRYEKSAR